MQQNINGILLLDKPIGISSNAALQKIKRLFNAKKAGHTGSLDPIATGMLPICFGEATKFSQYLLDSNKTYFVTAQLGVTTTTGDSEGEIISRTAITVTEEQIKSVLAKFIGEIDQIPPMYSAIKHQGKPLYEFARKGIQIERKSRRIKIFSIHFEKWEKDLLTFRVHCSKGTYIRTLVEEIGKQLGCGAYVSMLRRLTVTPYENSSMHTLDTLEVMENINDCLLPVETSIQIFPEIQLSTSAIYYLRLGQSIRMSANIESKFVRIISEEGKFIGIGEVLAEGKLKPHRLVSVN